MEYTRAIISSKTRISDIADWLKRWLDADKVVVDIAPRGCPGSITIQFSDPTKKQMEIILVRCASAFPEEEEYDSDFERSLRQGDIRLIYSKGWLLNADASGEGNQRLMAEIAYHLDGAWLISSANNLRDWVRFVQIGKLGQEPIKTPIFSEVHTPAEAAALLHAYGMNPSGAFLLSGAARDYEPGIMFYTGTLLPGVLPNPEKRFVPATRLATLVDITLTLHGDPVFPKPVLDAVLAGNYETVDLRNWADRVKEKFAYPMGGP